jgi:predicted small integral membrane protein
MLTARYAKIAMSLALAAFCLLVAFDNLTDYATNYLFVQHVMSMDTTFPGNTLMYRSITSPLLWHLAYALIIAAEGLTGILYLAGAIRLFQARRESGAIFNEAKGLVIAASLLAFLVWFFGFMVVAGEWFAMWESSTWNGQEPAFRFYMTALAVLIFICQPDDDIAETADDVNIPQRTTSHRDASRETTSAPKRRRGDVTPKRRRTDKIERS